MSNIIISTGFTINGYWISPFELLKGQVISLWLPQDTEQNEGVGSKIESQLIKLLSGKQTHNALTLIKRFMYIEDYKGDDWFKEHFYPTTPERYLKKNSKLLKAERNQILNELISKPALPLNRFGGNTRRMLALLACMSKSNNILFNVGGLDSQGVNQVYQQIEKMVDQGGSAIELNYPYLSGGNPPQHMGRHQFGKAKVIKIEKVYKEV
ncbi:hypothetical protein GXP67_18410 [Rhodocytophaga rosea]|uniref:Uncharacterized protein n=1 Tax=Rhodocytophaga rosea TaxID=2704465 RepID=A0A6C0GKY4_9BACT|nr:hypothetical protein [Rhodocytophaga rosea]QHT68474.1 hypothetical protein GXP67_18410 [Rhodocytophaga rosea]